MPSTTPNGPRWNNDSNLPRGNALNACPTTPSWPTTTPEQSDTYTLEDYKKLLEARNCRSLSDEEKLTLERGCIGITALELGVIGNPSLDNSYATLDQAKARAKEMQEECGASGRKPMIFSKRFYSDGKPYTPDPKTGKIDMSEYTYKAKSGFFTSYVNFDYGFYDEKANCWWHANHKEPGMKVYRSTLEHYSRPLLDFDRQVFAVACGKM